jgi:hypothetical protein
MDSSRLPPRVLLVLLVGSCVVAVAAVVTGLVTGRTLHDRPVAVAGVLAPVGDPAGAAHAAGDDRPALRAARVLRAWDHRRARAWARGDVAGLRALYAPGSRAGRRDAAMLRAWQQRGLAVRGMRMQVLDLRVVSAGARRLELAVTDRLAHAVAVDGAVDGAVGGAIGGAIGGAGGGPRALRLPRDAASARRIVLQRTRGSWQVVAVRDRAQPAR